MFTEKRFQPHRKLPTRKAVSTVMSVLYSLALHYTRWDRRTGKKKAWRQPDLERLYNNEGSPGTSDLPNPGEKNRQNSMNRIFVSLAKILKERLQFLKKPINNLVIMEMANVPYFYLRLCLCVCVCVCVYGIHVGGVSVFLSEGKRVCWYGGRGAPYCISYMGWVFRNKNQVLQIFIYPTAVNELILYENSDGKWHLPKMYIFYNNRGWLTNYTILSK